MDFTLTIDGIKFTAKKEDIDEIIDYIILSYAQVDDERAYNTQVVCDSNKVIDYVIKRLTGALDKFVVYDFTDNKTPDFKESFYSLIIEHQPTIAKGMEEYCEYLQENYFNHNKINCNFKLVDEAKEKLYYRSINFRRDSTFNEFKSKVIFVFSNNECTIFNNVAYDFCSQYGEVFDFNQAFKPVVEENYKDLREYLMQINSENHCVKEYRLKQES